MAVEEKEPKPVPNFVILASQVDSFCQAVTLAMQLGQPLGDASKTLLQTLVREAKRCFHGKAFENLTEVAKDATPADLLANALVLRATLTSMLDQGGRDEVAAAQQTWGLGAIHELRRKRPETLS